MIHGENAGLAAGTEHQQSPRALFKTPQLLLSTLLPQFPAISGLREALPYWQHKQGVQQRSPNPKLHPKLIYLHFKRNLKTTRCRKQLKP